MLQNTLRLDIIWKNENCKRSDCQSHSIAFKVPMANMHTSQRDLMNTNDNEMSVVDGRTVWCHQYSLKCLTMLHSLSDSPNVSAHHKSNWISQIDSISISQPIWIRYAYAIALKYYYLLNVAASSSHDILHWIFVHCSATCHIDNIYRSYEECLPPSPALSYHPIHLYYHCIIRFSLCCVVVVPFYCYHSSACKTIDRSVYFARECCNVHKCETYNAILVRAARYNVFHWFVISVAFNSITNTRSERACEIATHW